MIIDSETKHVCFSKKLIELRFTKEYEGITAILDEQGISHGFLEGTNDIWCRDYMPIQVREGKLVQFRYEPSYLTDTPEHIASRSDPEFVCKQNQIDPVFSKINLDGGNVVRAKSKVILTDRVFDENREINKMILVNELECLLEADIVIIPQIKSDFTGHADGLIRFLNDKTILVNEFRKMPRYWQLKMKRVISANNLEYIEIPCFEDARNGFKRQFPDSAIGNYINFLEVSNLIILPVFEIEGARDAETVLLFEKLYPGKTIRAIEINEIAKLGGLLNCITWNISRPIIP